MNVQFPEKLSFLFEPHRYKVAKGGRGSAKSWSFARAILIQGTMKPMRVGCFREVQKSIKDSVHKLLSDQIQALGLSWFYEVLDHTIRAKNGGEILFSGLATQTVDSIKSFEGLDIAWVEEAHAVSKKSWSVLIPTIRKEGSEIWASYNPELDTDETHQRFAVDTPPDCVLAHVNYMDNPWFPKVLELERQHAERTLPKSEYENIWLGQCKPAIAGAIYYDEMARVDEQKRVCNVPYDPMLKVHVIMDLGWNDSMAISLVQKQASELRVIEYIEDSHRTLADYSIALKEKRYNWGKLYLPHDGKHRDYKYGKSAEEIMQGLGWDVAITPNMSIEDGIRLTRMAFSRIYFDKTHTERLVQCAKRYRRAINQQTQEPGAPLHDEFSHGADCLRYVVINAESMTNEEWGGELNYNSLGVV